VPNSFTVFPNLLPGNVTIGGNLTVSGDQVRIGAASPFMRIGKNVFSEGQLSFNLGFDRQTLDNAGFQGSAHLLLAQNNPLLADIRTPAGTDMFPSYPFALFTDYTSHAHTGTTTEDTIISKTILGGILGANGGYRVRILWQVTALLGANSILHFYLGGGTQVSFTATTVSKHLVDITVANRNAQNNQIISAIQYNLSTGVIVATQLPTAAVDYSVDEVVKVTIQSSNVGDAQNLEAFIMTLENSFGPV